MANYYTVYNKNDEIIAAGDARTCAKQMNRSLASFYCTVGRTRSGKHHKYAIEGEALQNKPNQS